VSKRSKNQNPMAEPEIVVIGSLNRDLVVRVEKFPGRGETVPGMSLETFCGGKGANQAYAAAKLGGRVAMAGAVGNDDAGKAQIANLKSVQVDITCIGRADGIPTGTAIIALEESGENRIMVIPGANGGFTPDKLPLQLLRSCRVVLLQLEVPPPTVEKAIEEAAAAGVRIILDPAPAPDSPFSARLLARVDYLTPNLSELAKLSRAPLRDDSPLELIAVAARSLCSRTVVVKLGPRGALIARREGFEHVPAFNVVARDTTAAGDCFNGAFAVALVEGKSEREAALFANAAAAYSVTRIGAQASMPDMSEVQALWKPGKRANE
jgi:ribokinase